MKININRKGVSAVFSEKNTAQSHNYNATASSLTILASAASVSWDQVGDVELHFHSGEHRVVLSSVLVVANVACTAISVWML